jgi:hypothetical protein
MKQKNRKKVFEKNVSEIPYANNEVVQKIKEVNSSKFRLLEKAY